MAYRVPLTRYRRIGLVNQAVIAVPLAEVQAHCAIETESQTPRITYLVQTACEKFEHLTGRPVLNTVYRASLDRWPQKESDLDWWSGVRDGHYAQFAENELEFFGGAGFQNSAFNFFVNWIKSFDDTNAETLFPAYNYHVDPYRSQVVLKQGITPPQGTRTVNPIELEFVAGYGEDHANIPMQLKEGIKAYVAYYLENAGDGVLTEGSSANAIGLGGLPLSVSNFWRDFIRVLT